MDLHLIIYRHTQKEKEKERRNKKDTTKKDTKDKY